MSGAVGLLPVYTFVARTEATLHFTADEVRFNGLKSCIFTVIIFCNNSDPIQCVGKLPF